MKSEGEKEMSAAMVEESRQVVCEVVTVWAQDAGADEKAAIELLSMATGWSGKAIKQRLERSEKPRAEVAKVHTNPKPSRPVWRERLEYFLSVGTGIQKDDLGELFSSHISSNYPHPPKDLTDKFVRSVRDWLGWSERRAYAVVRNAVEMLDMPVSARLEMGIKAAIGIHLGWYRSENSGPRTARTPIQKLISKGGGRKHVQSRTDRTLLLSSIRKRIKNDKESRMIDASEMSEPVAQPDTVPEVEPEKPKSSTKKVEDWGVLDTEFIRAVDVLWAEYRGRNGCDPTVLRVAAEDIDGRELVMGLKVERVESGLEVC